MCKERGCYLGPKRGVGLDLGKEKRGVRLDLGKGS